MKNFICLLFFTVLAFTAFCQDGLADVNVGVSVFVAEGLPITLPKNLLSGSQATPFERFTTNYNELYKNDLTNPLGTMQTKFSFSAGVHNNIGWFYDEICYHTYLGESTSDFKNGNKRVFELHNNGLDILIGAGIARENFSLFFVIGGRIGIPGNSLNTYMQYPDGFKSYGAEYALNGNYKSPGIDNTIVGLRLNVGAKRFKAMLLIDDFLPSAIQGTSSSQLRDNYSSNVNVNAGRTRASDYIGVDLKSYLKDPNQYIIDDGELLTSAIRGLQMRIGVSYSLF